MRCLSKLLSVLLLAGLALPARGSDHLDAPLVIVDGRLDVNDGYIFQSPANANRTVMIMTVNPAAGVLSPTSFNPQGEYLFDVDTDGDAIPNVTFSVRFGIANGNGQQRFVLRRNGALIARGITGSNTLIRSLGGGSIVCDLFDDPFFFDLEGFQNGFQFSGNDFFAGLNVSAIVIELPRDFIGRGATSVGVNFRTKFRGEQFDRFGRPAVNTALIPSSMKDAFNAGFPENDFANFGAIVQSSIESLNGGDTATAQALSMALLPDLMTADLTSGAGFEALNGRKLADDVIDIELNLLSNGGVTTDLVDANDVPFRTGFPYLAVPNP